MAAADSRTHALHQETTAASDSTLLDSLEDRLASYSFLQPLSVSNIKKNFYIGYVLFNSAMTLEPL